MLAIHFLLLFAFVLVPYESCFASRATMDQIACAVGTDKSSLGHNYTRIYSKYFDSMRDKPLKSSAQRAGIK